MRRLTRVTTMIMVLPLLALLVSSVVFLARLGKDAWRLLPEVVSAEAQQYVNGRVEIGAIEARPIGRLAIRDITLRDELTDEPVLSVPRVVVRYRAGDLLRRKTGLAGSITRVDVSNPQVLIERRPEGDWNVSRFLKPTAPDRPLGFSGKVVVSGARVTLLDRMPHPDQPVINELNGVCADLDFSEMSVVRYAVSGRGQPDRLGEFTVKGQYGLADHKLNADLELSDVRLEHFRDYPVPLGLDISSGDAELRLNLSKSGRDAPFRYSGKAEVSAVEVNFPQIRKPVEQISGIVEFRDGLVDLDLNGVLGTSPVTASGRVLPSPDTRLSLDVGSVRANFEQLADLAGFRKQLAKVRLPRTGRVNAHVYGPPRSLRVDFDASAPSLAYDGWEGRSVSARGSYQNGRLSVSRAAARIYGGEITASANVSMQKGARGELNAMVSGVDLGTVSALRDRALDVTLTGVVNASWSPGAVSVEYRGRATDGSFNDVSFDEGQLLVRYDGSRVHVSEASVAALGGRLSANGEVSLDGDLDLAVSASDLDIRSLANLAGQNEASGRLSFTGSLQGSADSPVFDGRIEATAFEASGFSAGLITGGVSASRDEVSLQDFLIHHESGIASASGKLLDLTAENPTLEFEARADSLSLQLLLGDSVPEGLSGGTVSGDLVASGPISRPRLNANVSVQGVSYRDVKIDSAEAVLAYADARLQIEEAYVRAGSGLISLGGEISEEDGVSVAFEARQIPLDSFAKQLHPYAVVRGSVSAVGNVDGALHSPSVRASLESDPITINGQTFDGLEGSVAWHDSTLDLSGVSLSNKDASFSIPSLTYDFQSRLVELSARAEQVPAQLLLALMYGSPAAGRAWESPTKLRSILDSLPKPFEGVLEASVTGLMDLGQEDFTPDLSVEVSGRDLNLASTSINTLNVSGSWRGEVATLSSLEAANGDTNIVAQASYGPENHVEVQLDAHGLPIELLSQWAEVPDNLSGKADVTIVASGPADGPTVDASIEIVGPTLGVVRVDRIRARMSANRTSPAIADRPAGFGRIEIDDLTVMLDEERFGATGYLPVDWQKLTIPPTGSLLLETHLDSGSLALLANLSGLQIETDPQGVFDGSVKLAGEVGSPTLEGMLIWRGGRIQPPVIREALEGIEARLYLDGSKVTIEKFIGRSAAGGSFAISGEAQLTDLKPVLDLAVETASLELSGENFSNSYGEEVDVRLDADLKIVGSWDRPTISGDAHVPVGSISMPGKPPSVAPHSGELPIDPRFSIVAVLGKDVHFKSARLKAPLQGRLDVRGSLSEPEVDGTMDISGGTIVMPMREMTILRGSTVRLRVSPNQPSTAYVDMTAQTRLTAMTGVRTRRRYTVTMTAQGPLDNLRPTFSSSPPGLSDDRIVALLTGQRQLELILAGNGQGAVGSELSSLFSSAVLPTVFAPIEEAFETALGFEEFSLEMGYHEPLVLTIGEHLFDRLYLDYTAALGARPDYADSLYELRLSYRLRNNLEIGVTRNDNNITTIGVEGRFRF